ncbi:MULTISPECIES: cell division protein SepF [unclassified Planococcus (in: firmicutes)]|uniref:cell division protein SepF n=1 Tax=unclassified Planococcus (in: firmicutes) TaxID=2662419 RepID=UPI000C33B635|nr:MULTISPECIES: cell division protein SepF [unclassified Planococcus (in: firmicutes)]AUD14155.1 cell division protein SepF [Planococcus sp. MB-3u-03]PKG48178.1 cell division protein SepF [Planococcus sp. Urea-trap-24]PKG92026.1 cell division protein SepF [Planococcus sp. Urea-3u-39]PKH43070.1 cell division protein SepF [Planococcus sp. MB-3u-09]
MSMKDKFKNFFYLDEYEEEPVQEERKQRPVQRYEKPAPAAAEQPQKKAIKAPKPVKERRENLEEPTVQNLVNLQNSSASSSKVSLAEPRVYAEAQDIAESLKTKQAVVVNLQRIERDQGLRIIDFLSGTVYALGGDIQRIGTDIFLCVPDTVEVDGAISDYYHDDQQ